MTIDLKDLFVNDEELDERSVRALLTAIKNNHDQHSFDYVKFKQSVNTLRQLNMDEITSYKSAFATASTMGLTKDSLLQSAREYSRVLDQEKESFADALRNQIDKKIEGRKAEVTELEKKIEAHKKKMKELEREIAIFQNRIDTVDQDVEAASQKINTAKENFLKVYENLISKIRSDINSIKTYL